MYGIAKKHVKVGEVSTLADVLSLLGKANTQISKVRIANDGANTLFAPVQMALYDLATLIIKRDQHMGTRTLPIASIKRPFWRVTESLKNVALFAQDMGAGNLLLTTEYHNSIEYRFPKNREQQQTSKGMIGRHFDQIKRGKTTRSWAKKQAARKIFTQDHSGKMDTICAITLKDALDSLKLTHQEVSVPLVYSPMHIITNALSRFQKINNQFLRWNHQHHQQTR